METVLGTADSIVNGVDGVNGLLDTAQEVLDVDVNITGISKAITVSLLLAPVISHPAVMTCSPQLALSLPNLAVRLKPPFAHIIAQLVPRTPGRSTVGNHPNSHGDVAELFRNSIARTAWGRVGDDGCDVQK